MDDLEAKREQAVDLLLDRIIVDAKDTSAAKLAELCDAYAVCSAELEYARGDGRSKSGL